MLEHPDSALRIIRSIDTLSLNTNYLRARYSLLLAMSLDKNYIDTTNIDVILPASEYFAQNGSHSDRMKAYFYQGRIYSNRGENESAMHYYLRALEDSSKVSDNRIKELVNSAISDIFSRNHNSVQELNYILDALRYGYSAGDDVGIWAMTGHLASCYGNLGMWDDAERTYEDFFSMPICDSLTFFKEK